MKAPLFVISALTFLFSSFSWADEKPNRLTVATWNLEWFFDAYQGDNSSDLSKKQSAPSRNEWDWKLNKVARVIGEMKPTILALQEVENRKVLRQLTKKLSDDHQLRYRIAFIQGWDNFTEQDVAIIYQSGLVRYSCREQSKEMYQSKAYYNLNKHLFADFEWGQGDEKESLTLLNVHLRAMPEKHDIRERQCKLMRQWLQGQLDSGNNVVVLGDFNTEELAGQIAAGSDLSILCGKETSSTADDLVDTHEKLNNNKKSTHLAGRQFDRILISQSLLQDQPDKADLKFKKIDTFKDLVVVGSPDEDHFDVFYSIPRSERDISDHYPVMAEFIFN